jgi:BTB/POZ domain
MSDVSTDHSVSLPEHIYYGDRETSNLCVVVGSGSSAVHLHVHWEVMASACSYFSKMKSSQMRECHENVVSFPNDSPDAWKSLIARIYPPLDDFDFASAVLIVPLISFLHIPWLIPKVKTLISANTQAGERTAAQADVLCANGFADIVEDWFTCSAWAVKAAPIFIKECTSAEAMRIAGSFILEALQSMTEKLQPFILSDFPAMKSLRKGKNCASWFGAKSTKW